MYKNMKYIGLVTALAIANAHADENPGCNTINITSQSDHVEYLQNISADKKLLVEEIIALVSAHLSQDEINSLIFRLQDLATNVTLQTLQDLIGQLKSEIMVFGACSFFGMGSQPSPAEEKATQEFETTLEQLLSKINLTQYEDFIRKNAKSLSRIIRSTVEDVLPDCIQSLTDILSTVNKIEQHAKLQEVLTNFIADRQDALSTL